MNNSHTYQLMIYYDRHLIQKNLSEFWLHAKMEYLILSEETMNALLPLMTSSLHENGSSAVTVVKTKYYSQLIPEKNYKLLFHQ